MQPGHHCKWLGLCSSGQGKPTCTGKAAQVGREAGRRGTGKRLGCGGRQINAGRGWYQWQWCHQYPILLPCLNPWTQSTWTWTRETAGVGLSRPSGAVQLTLGQGNKCSLTLRRSPGPETSPRNTVCAQLAWSHCCLGSCLGSGC